ncbi:zinc finger protein ZFAT isoform X2 [Kryptolebias marmoratus]|uniref:zinc finger protein ZFAT isoform X2 n=1 Tax=Kryptolebias marmoratus TaxID=37003 RepID=UPI0007F89ABE|nr:zinc finger protein ZFAT isoform X2 [Kryptolebias marmoratus]
MWGKWTEDKQVGVLANFNSNMLMESSFIPGSKSKRANVFVLKRLVKTSLAADFCAQAGSVFMCRLCHLFSPSRSQLLVHCSQLHPQHESTEDIMIALQPLIAEPVEKLAEGPVKRKRGRPKGSTKKTHINLTEETSAAAHSAEDDSQREQKRNKEEDQGCSLDKVAEGEILKLECRHCHRSFGNKRQILKHICLKQDDKEEDDTENEGVCGAEVEGGSGGATVNHAKQKSARGSKEKDVNSFKLSRGNISNEEDPTSGQKKSVIGVVLTEDKILPGVSKMVPVEDNSAETESAAVRAHHQPVSGVTASENNTTEQEPSPNSAAAETNKGFQEYSIKQDNINLRPNQLKIFACEFCHKIFKFRHSLVSHLRTHTQEKPFQCPHCDYASAIKANLNVHLRKHTGEKFSCDHCSFSSPSPGHLKVHVERVHQKVKQHCGFCEKKYSDVKNLLKHMERHHNLKEPAVFQNYQEQRLKTRKGLRQLLYHCPTCNRHFKNQLSRERHMLMHGPQPPFACSLCDYAATKMVALAAHVRKHLFLYVCCACDRQLVSSHRLRGHLKESHPELDPERAFADSISISYCLIPPEGGGGSEEAQRRAMEEHEEGEDDRGEAVGIKERDREQQTMKEQDRSLDGRGEVQITAGASEKEDEEELRNKGAQESSQDRCEEAAAEEKLHKTTCPPVAENTHTLSPETVHDPLREDGTQENTRTSAGSDTSSSLGNTDSDLSKDTPSSSGPQVDNGHTSLSEKSAFQQVFSSLQKTRLDMDTFQRLRKIYGDLECQHCGKLFWYKVHFNVHVRTHTREHLHYCSKCSYSSITKSSLNRHQIQKHSGLLLPCSVPGCKYTTPDKYKLQAHTKTHHNQGSSATCPVCQCSFPEHRLKYHIRSSHPDEVPMPGKKLMVQRAEKCPYCDSYFLKNSSDFQQHIWAHQGLKPYVCGVCNYSSRNRSNLKTHMNRHNTESRHLCDLCGKKFKSKLTLKSHRLSHTDEGKKFQCSECHFKSVFKPSLLRHMEQHAKFKPVRCAHCHYSCNVAGVLKRHYKMKHPDETYENDGPGLPSSDTLEQQGALKCPECEFVYGTKWELNRHLKNKHNLKVVEARWEVAEETEAQFVSVEDEEQLTDAPVAILEDSVNIQQLTKLSSETHSAVASLVAMGPGTVAVVQQLQVAEEQEVGDCSEQLMVVNAEGAVDGNQVMVVEETSGLEALTVLTQGENAHHYIVYIQEQTVEIN